MRIESNVAVDVENILLMVNDSDDEVQVSLNKESEYSKRSLKVFEELALN